MIVSREDTAAYAFLSDGFKQLGKLNFLRKGTPLPASLTKDFNANSDNVRRAKRECASTTLHNWFDGPRGVELVPDGTKARGRPVAICSIGNTDIGALQVLAGPARDCPRFSGGRYSAAEATARASGRNLSAISGLPSYCTPQ